MKKPKLTEIFFLPKYHMPYKIHFLWTCAMYKIQICIILIKKIKFKVTNDTHEVEIWANLNILQVPSKK